MGLHRNLEDGLAAQSLDNCAIATAVDAMAMDQTPDNDTFPKMIARHARERGGAVAAREKEFGIWQSTTWQQTFDHMKNMAMGLAAQGFERGHKLAIIGDNRPDLYRAIAAAQALGGVPVPIYQDSIADEMEFILEHAEARFAIAEDQEQVDKLLAIRDRLPNLKGIIYSDPRGMRHYDEPGLESLEVLEAAGAAHAKDHPNMFDEEISRGKGSDIAAMLYTSGTTGQPKGVMLTHDNIAKTSTSGIQFERLRADDEVVAYMPMAWVGDHIFSYGQAICAGFTVNCPESADTVLQDIREIGPSYFFAPPRIWENILTSVMVRIEDASALKRWAFHRFMKIAERVGVKKTDGESIGAWDNFIYWLGELFIYGPLKDNLGLSRIRVAYTAGEAIGPEIFTFYRSIGVNIKQIYGMTEACALVCGQKDNEVRADTVGKPMPGVELKIDENGEVMFRGPGVFAGYFKNEEATVETKTNEGWIRSGDAGVIDDDGQLRIIDRAKDVGRLNDGSMFAPKYIENKLKFSPYIREVVAHGNDRDMVTAFINIDLDAVGNWAERRGVVYTSYTDLASRDEVYDLIEGEVAKVNQGLKDDRQLGGSIVRRFLILHKELDPDDNELTRTRKVRRRFIAEKYNTLIDALYDGSEAIAIEAQVTFEDGRTGTVNATLKIRTMTDKVEMAKAA